MRYINKHLVLIILIFLSVVVFIRGLIFLDPDFGWHLQEGQLIIQSGIQRVDPFSYTMPSFSYVDHEWLSNVFIALIYDNFGIIGLSFISSCFFFLALFLAIPKKFKNYSLIPIALAGALMIGTSGIRPQVESWMFFALLLKIIFDEKLWIRFKYLIPLIFIIWANLHGGFAVGIMLLLIIFVIKTIETKCLALTEFRVFFASALATLINPYGLSIWREIWMTASDVALKSNIKEWLPSVYFFDLSYLILIALSLTLIIIYGRKFNYYEKIIYFTLLIMAASSLRHVPLWAIFSVTIVSKELHYFFTQINTHKDNLIRFKKIKIILIIIFVIVFSYEIFISLTHIYDINKYPVNAVKFLQKLKLEGNLFSTYDFGGYLIWKLPQEKVYIDGRMPSWRREGNYPNESNYAYGDYVNMLGNNNFFKQQLIKYNIHYVLLPKAYERKVPPKENKLLSFEKKFIKNQSDFHIFFMDLTKLGMKKIYEDEKYIIYKI